MPLAEVHVTLKPALFDAQGETIKKALHQLGYADVQSVRIGKFISIELSGGGDDAGLQGRLDSMCRQLLSNPVIEDYEVSLGGADPIVVADATALPLVEGAPSTNGAVTDLPGEARTQSAHAEGVTTSRQVAGNQAAATTATGVEAVSTPGGVTDPFQVDFKSYEAMATEAKQSLRILALRKYGNWIEAQLRAHNSNWILCLGQTVIEYGNDIENSPSDQHLLKMGIEYDRVPWVFNRPQT